jgi:hypothetical protein
MHFVTTSFLSIVALYVLLPSRNVLVRAAPRKSNQDRHTIIFLDAGIATSLKPNDRKNLRDLFRAVVLNDGYNAGALMVERARYERCSSVPGGKHAFASGVSNIVSEFHDRRKQGGLSRDSMCHSVWVLIPSSRTKYKT